MRLCRRLKVALATLLSFYEDGRIRNLLEISLIRFIFTIYSFFSTSWLPHYSHNQ
jgi:hypothetical protein